MVPIRSVKVRDKRGRRDFKDIQGLAESLKENGFIHPPTVMTNGDGSYTLIAGERRYRAAILAGFAEIPVTVRDDLSELEYRTLELEENVQRSDLSWDEQVDMMERLHKLKVEANPEWTQADTATLTRQSRGHVSLQIQVSEAMKADPTLRSRVKKLDIRSAAKVIQREKAETKARRMQEQGLLEITEEFQLGDCRSLIKTLETDSVHCVIMDPPYGLERLEKMREAGEGAPVKSFALMSDTHNMTIEEVCDLLAELSPQLSRVCIEGAHIYVFSAFQFLGQFISALHTLEFQPPCLVWDHERTTQPGLGYNYISRCEPIAMFHNPPRGRRLAKSMGNIISHPEVPRGIERFATAKPEGLLGTLIQQSTIMGERVLDPFGGSGSTLRAARLTSRRGVSFEIDEPTYQRTLLSLQGEPEKESEEC